MTLNFKNHVLKSFDFLRSDYEFHCVLSDDYYIRYESKTVFVNISFDNGRSFELGIEVGQKNVLFNGQEQPFNMGEILRLKSIGEKENFFFQASNQQYLINLIDRLSNLLKSYGNDLLIGNSIAYESLGYLRIRECKEYAIERDLKFIRSEVNKAWKEKDFGKVVNLYNPVKAYITDSEKKKLEYAEKHKRGNS